MELQDHITSSIVEWLREELAKPTWHWLRVNFRKLGESDGGPDGGPVHQIDFRTDLRFCDANVRCVLLLTPDRITFMQTSRFSNQPINGDNDCILDYADPKLFDRLIVLVNRIPFLGGCA